MLFRSVVVDRLVIKEGIQQRLSDSIETSLKLSEGIVTINRVDGGDFTFNTKFSCAEHGVGIAEMEPRMFSFNAPYGACPDCNGLGFSKKVDPELLVPDTKLSVKNGALLPIANSAEGTFYVNMIHAIIEEAGESIETPFKDLSERVKHEIFYGTGHKKVKFNYESRYVGESEFDREFEGLVHNLERRYASTNSEYMRSKIEEFMSMIECETCHGKRLKDEVLAVTVGGKNIWQVTCMSVKDALNLDRKSVV